MPTVPRTTISPVNVDASGVADRNRRSVPFSSPDAFGSAPATAVQQAGREAQTVGNILSVGAGLIKHRTEAIARAKDEQLFRSTAKQLFMDEETKGSAFAEPEAIPTYASALNQAIQERLEQHTGSDASKMVLRSELETIRGQLTDAAVTRGLQAQRKQVASTIQERIADHTQIATREPLLAASVIDDVPNVVAKFADVLTPDEQDEMIRAGKEQIMLGVLDTFMARGAVKEADELLSTSASFMSPEAGRQYRNRIAVTQAKKFEMGAQVAHTMSVLQTMGVDTKSLTVPQKLAIAGINLPSEPNRPKTDAEKISSFEQAMSIATNKEYRATPDDVRKILNVEDKPSKDKPVFGGSLQGMAAVRANELLAGFANGQTSPDEDNDFITAATFLSAPNPITGEPNPLSPTIRAALQRRGIDPDNLSQARLGRSFTDRLFAVPTQAEPEQAPQPTGEQPAAVPSASAPAKGEAAQPLDPSGQLGQITSQVDVYAEKAKTSGGLFSKKTPDPPITLFGMADKLTGPVSSFQQTASGVAGLDTLIDAPEVRQARRFFDTFKLDLARSLQNNPKFPVSELERVFESLNLESSFIGSPKAFQQDLIGLSEFLEQKAQSLQQTVQGAQVSREEKRHSADALNLINKALRVIGAPPKFDTPELARESVQKGELAPGDYFRLPDPAIPGGRLMRVKPVTGAP